MKSILTINAGSSSIKFAVFSVAKLKDAAPITPDFFGKIDRIGLDQCTYNFTDSIQNKTEKQMLEKSDRKYATKFLLDHIDKMITFDSEVGIGHRIVHGMQFAEPQPISSALIAKLKEIASFDPDHLPIEIDLIEKLEKRYPKLHQVACFDTSFHHNMPKVAKLLAIPRKYFDLGVQRYGFHGISYSYLLQELTRLQNNRPLQKKIILLHLGSGASLAAIEKGKCIDTSMGFSPASGLVMGTRSGDLDPGVEPFLAKNYQFSSHSFFEMVNSDSGLLGISETSSDMEDLLKCESSDIRAHEAIEMFCRQIKKWVGSFVALLGGLDCIVFAGGIGENSPAIRARICEGFEFIGMQLDPKLNHTPNGLISSASSEVRVWVIPTNEEWMIAKSVVQVA